MLMERNGNGRTSRKGDPLNATPHLCEATQLWINLNRGDARTCRQASQHMATLMECHRQYLHPCTNH